MSLVFDKKSKRNEDVSECRRIFREMIELAGGIEWAAVDIGKPISYASKISEALNGIDGRHIQFEEWFPSLLDDERAIEAFYVWLGRRTQREVPKKLRVATDAELLQAVLAEADDAGPIGESLLERAAKRIGTDRGAFRR